MSYKTYNRKHFTVTVASKKYDFTCYGQGTRNGFRHICYKEYNDLPKQYIPKPFVTVNYLNRTWERFAYETVLTKAIDKLNINDDIKRQLKDILIEQKIEEHKQVEEDLQTFKALYEGCSNTLKDKLKDVTLTNNEQVQTITTLMKFDNAIQQLKGV